MPATQVGTPSPQYTPLGDGIRPVVARHATDRPRSHGDPTKRLPSRSRPRA